MARTGIPVALALGLALAAPASSADQKRIASYCSPSGDVCYGIFDDKGAIRLQLTTAAKYFSRYRICVRPAGQAAECKSFPVRKVGSMYGGKVIWQKNFGMHGPTSYRVTWLQGKQALGPALKFTLPAPV